MSLPQKGPPLILGKLQELELRRYLGAILGKCPKMNPHAYGQTSHYSPSHILDHIL